MFTLTYLQLKHENRISSSLDKHQLPKQTAYRRGFSTIDIPFCIAFVDYEKVFDSIQHRAVFEALRAHDMQEKYINIIKGTYADETGEIRTKMQSGNIKIMEGVRQGDTLSPVMFTATVEEIFKRMKIEAGININGVRLSNLRFADDIILFAESKEKLKDMLGDLNNEGKRDEMKLNKNKIKIMCNDVARRRLRTGVMIDREQLEEVTECKYLETLITSGNEISKEIG